MQINPKLKLMYSDDLLTKIKVSKKIIDYFAKIGYKVECSNNLDSEGFVVVYYQKDLMDLGFNKYVYLDHLSKYEYIVKMKYVEQAKFNIK
jgi:hypothetical protein